MVATALEPVVRLDLSWLAGRITERTDLHGEEEAFHGLHLARGRGFRIVVVRGGISRRRELRGHAYLIHDYATGRRFNPAERMLFAAAARDPKLALAFDELATRRTKPGRMLARAVPRVIAVNARHAIGRRRDDTPTTGDGARRIGAALR